MRREVYGEPGIFKERLIRDRVLVGLFDEDVFERLNLPSDLDLATAVTKARNSDAVKAQQSIVRGPQATPTPLLFLLTLCTAMPNKTGHNANVLPEKKENYHHQIACLHREIVNGEDTTNTLVANAPPET